MLVSLSIVLTNTIVGFDCEIYTIHCSDSALALDLDLSLGRTAFNKTICSLDIGKTYCLDCIYEWVTNSTTTAIDCFV